MRLTELQNWILIIRSCLVSYTRHPLRGVLPICRGYSQRILSLVYRTVRLINNNQKLVKRFTAVAPDWCY